MQIIAISDTHGKHRDVELPKGDVLVHAGDFTVHGEKSVTLDFVNWFSEQSFEHKIFISGNHDMWAESHEVELSRYASEQGVHYLCNSSVELEGMKFWGSPKTPRFMDWAFMYSPGREAESQWSQIPATMDVIVTHGPPQGILDDLYVASDNKIDNDLGLASAVGSHSPAQSQSVGCEALAKRVMQIKPRLHVFGHIHEAFGSVRVGRTQFVNASVMDRHYNLANSPHQLDLSDLGANNFSENTLEEQELPRSVATLVLDSVG